MFFVFFFFFYETCLNIAIKSVIKVFNDFRMPELTELFPEAYNILFLVWKVIQFYSFIDEILELLKYNIDEAIIIR